MDMVKVMITIPRSMVSYIDDSEQGHSFERNAMVLYPFIRNAVISHGRAAEILGVHKFDLIDFYGRMGLPYIDQSVSDLEEELADIHDFEGAMV